MSHYFQIENSSIRRLRKEWDRFIDNCFETLEKHYNECSHAYFDEAAHDKYMEEYTEESIDDCYRSQMENLNNWAESFKDDFRETYRAGNKIIDELENKKFYDEEDGYTFTLNFCDGKIEKEYNDDGYRVVFRGMYWDIEGVIVHFDPTSPEYTDWIPTKSR